MCDLYSITMNQAAIAALWSSPASFQIILRR